MREFEAEIQELKRIEQMKQDVLEKVASKLRAEFPNVAGTLETLGGKETMIREFLYATLNDPADNREVTDLEYARKYGEMALWEQIENKVCPPQA